MFCNNIMRAGGGGGGSSIFFSVPLVDSSVSVSETPVVRSEEHISSSEFSMYLVSISLSSDDSTERCKLGCSINGAEQCGLRSDGVNKDACGLRDIDSRANRLLRELEVFSDKSTHVYLICTFVINFYTSGLLDT